MLIRYLEEIKKSDLNVDWGKGKSRRLLTKKDSFGFSFSDTLIDSGSEYELQYPNHLEACYILEGTGTLYFNCKSIELYSGVLYGLNNHDLHKIVAHTELRMICVFLPALEGKEKHDFTQRVSRY